MPLAGALFNHADRLDRLEKLKRRLLSQAAQSPHPPAKAQPPHGAAQEAVVKVLTACTPEPMQIKDIKAAVERILKKPVSRDTINSCLSVGAKRADPRFVRVKPGWYRLA